MIHIFILVLWSLIGLRMLSSVGQLVSLRLERHYAKQYKLLDVNDTHAKARLLKYRSRLFKSADMFSRIS